MRKYIIGAIVGFCLAFTVSANAEEVKNLIGMKIEGTFPVKVNGDRIEKDAIVVDGSSYLPVRAFGDSVGYDVKFDTDLGIELIKKEEPTVTATSSTQPTVSSPSPTPVPIENQIKALQNQIKSKKFLLSSVKALVEKEPNAVGIESRKQEIAKAEAEIASLESQLAELEAQQ